MSNFQLVASQLIYAPPEATPQYFMQRALELGRLAQGRCSPNPAVGAVVVDHTGQIVGEGFTQPPGSAHAEVMALRQAGAHAKGGTLYVTLEPCAAEGRTPPCVEAIIRAGLQRVYYAVADPNPKMCGGAQLLRQAGIEVLGGLLEEEARQAHAPFFHWLRTGQPYLVAKYAMTLDGKIATHTGDSRWISGSPSRQLVHALRDECDAVLVGLGTVLADDPALTVRLADFPSEIPSPSFYNSSRKSYLPDPRLAASRSPRQPVSIVVDSAGKIPLTAKLVRPGTLLATTDRIPHSKQSALTERGVEVLLCPATAEGRVNLPALLKNLGQRGLLQVLLEGGSSLLASFLFGAASSQTVRPNKVWAFIAPKLVGGTTALSPLGGTGCARMSEALELQHISWHKIGNDLLAEGYLAADSNKAQNSTGLE